VITMAHAKKHAINDINNHNPGTNGNVIGTVAGAVAQVPFSQSATVSTIAQRDGSGDVIVPGIPSSGGAATSRDYVTSVISGYRVPVQVLSMKSDVAQAGAPPAAVAGDAWVVNTWGVPYNNGDIYEYDGAAWNLVLANGGGAEPPNGTRVLVKSAGAAGSFAGQAKKIAQYDNVTHTWSFTFPIDGDLVAIIGENSIYENLQYIYDASSASWVSMGSAIQHNSTGGLQGGSVGLSQRYHMTSAEHTEALRYKADVALAAAIPVVGDVTLAGWVIGDRGLGIHVASNSVWLIMYYGVGTIKSVQLT
jgi:hypothetical protein